MKKILVLATMLLSFGIYGYCQTNIVGTPTRVTTVQQGEKFHNSILAIHDATQVIGSSTTRFSTIYSSGIGGGIVQQSVWLALPLADSNTVITVTLSTSVALSTTSSVGMTNPTVPRNLTFQYSFADLADYVTPVTSHTLVGGRITIVGTNQRGEYVTETTDLLTAPSVNYSTHCYSTVTSYSITGTRFNVGNIVKVRLCIGTGNRIGLPGEINYATDIIAVNENGTRTTTYGYNIDSDWIDFVTDGNTSNNYTVLFKNKNIP